MHPRQQHDLGFAVRPIVAGANNFAGSKIATRCAMLRAATRRNGGKTPRRCEAAAVASDHGPSQREELQQP